MADHYRALAQSLVNIGFLFRRQGEGRREIWRNRQTLQDVIVDRDEVTKSRAAADAVLAVAQALLRGHKPPKGEPADEPVASRRRSVADPSHKSSNAAAKPSAKPGRPTPKRSSPRRLARPPGKRAKGGPKRS